MTRLDRLPQIFRRCAPALVAGLALAPVGLVWDSMPAASLSTADTDTNLTMVALPNSDTPTLRARVTGAPDGADAPTGSVAFAIEGSGAVQCDDLATNVVEMSGGVATCKVTSPLAGSDSAQTALAIYTGDDGFTASVGTVTSSDGSFTPGSSTGPGTGTPQPPSQPPSGGMAAPPGYTSQQLIFDDQFSGTSLDTSKWTTALGAQGIVWNNKGSLPTPYSGPNVPGDGTEAAMFAPSQVSVDNGLTLTAQPNSNQYAGSYPWISGVVTTEGKFSLPAGGWYVQVEAKMPDQSAGMWPAIWFFPGVAGGPVNEFDGYEGGWLGDDPNTIMHSDYFADQGQQQSAYSIGSDVTAGYHVYGFQFIPGQSITAYFDGAKVWQVNASDGITITGEPYEILLELQVASQQTSGWHTVTTGTTPSASMEIAEVQAYS
jgi:glycosyl hydrolase family 16